MAFENIVGIGGNTGDHHFLLVKPIPTQRHLLTPLGNKPFENTVGKGEIAQCFQPVWIAFCHFAIFVKFEIVVCKLFQFGRV